MVEQDLSCSRKDSEVFIIFIIIIIIIIITVRKHQFDFTTNWLKISVFTI